MRRFRADHHRIDLSYGRFEREPVDRRSARSHPLNGLIVSDDQGIFAGDGKLHPFRVAALKDRFLGGELLKVGEGLIFTPSAFQSFEQAVGFGIERNKSSLPFWVK